MWHYYFDQLFLIGLCYYLSFLGHFPFTLKRFPTCSQVRTWSELPRQDPERPFPFWYVAHAHVFYYLLTKLLYKQIPAVELLSRAEYKHYNGTGVIVLTPTRELAMQIYGVLAELMQFHTQTHGNLIIKIVILLNL